MKQRNTAWSQMMAFLGFKSYQTKPLDWDRVVKFLHLKK